MVSRGAKIIFATSYGHLDAALKVAKAHPDVVVVQQGNFIEGSIPDNAGTYFGTVYEPVYLAGIAAGLTTKTDKLGYVYAFPIPQTINNIDAFQLGAQSVNPDVKTYTINTSNWCDPAAQAEATRSLLSQGVDVITQHQDCTSTVIKTTESAGKFTVGYHADASKLAPKGWIAGSEWSWGDMYTDIVKTALAGDFVGSKYNANYRVGYKTGGNPFVQSKFGSMITAKDQQMIEDAKAKLTADGSPFAGPVYDQSGKVIFAAGVDPDVRGDRGHRRVREGCRRGSPEELIAAPAAQEPGGRPPFPAPACRPDHPTNDSTSRSECIRCCPCRARFPTRGRTTPTRTSIPPGTRSWSRARSDAGLRSRRRSSSPTSTRSPR